VTVTAHAASHVAGSATDLPEQWRVLRFNAATRQSVARVHIVGAAGRDHGHDTAGGGGAGSGANNVGSGAGGVGSGGGNTSVAAATSTAAAVAASPMLVADPRCLGFEYTKTIASAGERGFPTCFVVLARTLAFCGSNQKLCTRAAPEGLACDVHLVMMTVLIVVTVHCGRV